LAWPRRWRGVGERGLLQRVTDGRGEAGNGSLGGAGRRKVDSSLLGVGLEVSGRVARPRREPLAKSSDVTAGEFVGRGLVLQAVELLLGGERRVGGPQSGVASERQLEEFPSGVAVEGGGDVDEVARQRAAEQRCGLRPDRVVEVRDRTDVEPDGVVRAPVTAQVELGRPSRLTCSSAKSPSSAARTTCTA
jgi:hypothetical protein